MSIPIIEVGVENVYELQTISKETFLETFSDSNSTKNITEYLNHAFSIDNLKVQIANTDSKFYLLKLNNEIVGYLKINRGKAQTELKSNNSLEIERIYVLKKAQGQKIGQILFQQALEFAKHQNLDFIWLGVWENNLNAISFYKKNGFIEFSKHIFKLGNEEQIDIMMKLQLKGL